VSTQPPEGLRLLGICAALFACVMLYLASGHANVGGVAGLLGTLALVAAEALWNGRSWAYRASTLLATLYFVVIIIGPILLPNAPPIGLIVPVLSAGAIIPALRYIRRQVSLLTPASSRTPVAVPRRTP
jgi:hypothetical protein